MKIAIPTNDGQKMTRSFESAGAFQVLTFKEGEVKKEELRKMRFSEIINFELFFQEKVKDCQYVIFGEIDEENREILQKLDIQCLATSEKLISDIANRFKEDVLVKTTGAAKAYKPVYNSK